MFKLKSNFKPAGGQPEAIKQLTQGYKKHKRQTLLGITGSGKTITCAHVINNLNKPTLVLAHNKTLAAQLYTEFKELFPDNAVEYFVSYYDYYQPESYIPQTDVYIEKDASVNEKIEKMRLKATASLMARDDVIIVASISCIYGLGDPKNFKEMAVQVKVDETLNRAELLNKLIDIQYERNNTEIKPGKFRVRGATIDVIPGYEKHIYRIQLEDDKVESIKELDHITNQVIRTHPSIQIFPARHFVIPEAITKRAIRTIKKELEEWAPTLPPLEQQRLTQRTKYDLEMLKEMGFCSGVENYSRHFENRRAGQPAHCLLDFFPKDFLLIIDESHQSIPQAHGMYKGDRARKKNLIDHGFRLPSAYDNRPLKFNEFEKYFNHTIFVSATPAEYEYETSGQVVEQIIRPTGLLDPKVEVRACENQVDDLFAEIEKTTKKGWRVLVTTLTKRMAEDLTNYLAKADIKVRYLHSEINTIQRTEIIRQLRLKEFDVLVGINLLREGLDIPEVALVAILDADKEGFLRNERSLIQTIGRAARNAEGRVILYADKKTESIKKAVDITRQRRKEQEAYNKKHKITPKTIIKKVQEQEATITTTKHLAKTDITKMLANLDAEMHKAADELDFETAIEIREKIKKLQKEI